MYLKKRAQSFAEYAMAAAIIAAAAVAMSWYLRRAIYARFSQVRQELNVSQRGERL